MNIETLVEEARQNAAAFQAEARSLERDLRRLGAEPSHTYEEHVAAVRRFDAARARASGVLDALRSGARVTLSGAGPVW